MPAHLRFPIAMTAVGRLTTVEQDSDSDIVQSVALLLDTRPGERRSVPDYGLPDPVFGGLLPAHVASLITTWEERADQTIVDQVAAQIGVQQLQVQAGTSGPGDYVIDISPDDSSDDGLDVDVVTDVSEE